MLGSGSQWLCCDGSHTRPLDGELLPLSYGTYQVPDAILGNYPKKEIKIEKGGM
jgi:hypothetical protein